MIFIKGLKNPNAKLSYTIEGTIAVVYFTYDLAKVQIMIKITGKKSVF